MSTQQHLSAEALNRLVCLADDLARGTGLDLPRLPEEMPHVVIAFEPGARAMAYAAHRLITLLSDLTGSSVWDLSVALMGPADADSAPRGAAQVTQAFAVSGPDDPALPMLRAQLAGTPLGQRLEEHVAREAAHHGSTSAPKGVAG